MTKTPLQRIEEFLVAPASIRSTEYEDYFVLRCIKLETALREAVNYISQYTLDAAMGDSSELNKISNILDGDEK